MIKKIITKLFLLLSLSSFGQSVNEAFLSMPNELLPGINRETRTILLADSNQVAFNFILGKITKLSHTDDYLEVRTSAVGTTQLKLLPVSPDSVIICLVRTVCGRACDSHISFFTTEWESLDASAFLPEISAKNFFNSSQKDSENYKYALSLSDILPISAQLNGTNNSIELTFNYKQHLSPDMIVQLTPFLKADTVVLQWHNNKFQ